MSSLFVALVFLFSVGFLILILAAHWKIFTMAGKPGWAAIIPIYNIYTWSTIAFGNASYFIVCIALYILSFIAQFAEISILVTLTGIASLVLYIVFSIKLCKVFEKSGGFMVGMIFLPFIFQPILGFGNSKYIGSR